MSFLLYRSRKKNKIQAWAGMAIKKFDPIRSPGQVGTGPNQQASLGWQSNSLFQDPNCKYVYEYSFTFSQQNPCGVCHHEKNKEKIKTGKQVCPCLNCKLKKRKYTESEDQRLSRNFRETGIGLLRWT